MKMNTLIGIRRFSSSSKSIDYLCKSKLSNAAVQMLESLPEIQQVKSSKFIKEQELSLLERAVEICESATGKESEYSAACIVLLGKASAAAGDFSRGKTCLEKLKKSIKLPVEPKWIQFFKNPSNSDLLVPRPSIEFTFPSDVATSEFHELVSKYPFEVAENARLLLSSYEEGNSESLTQALALLDLVNVEDIEQPQDAFGAISLLAHQQTSKYQVNALLGITLGMIAREMHIKEGKAVSAEGLYRASIDKLNGLCSEKHCYLRYLAKPYKKYVSENYALLLDDWENRERDAMTVREAVQSIEGDYRLLLQNSQGWDRMLI